MIILYTGKFLRHFIFMNFTNFVQSWNLIPQKFCHATPFMLPMWIIHENIFLQNNWNCHFRENFPVCGSCLFLTRNYFGDNDVSLKVGEFYPARGLHPPPHYCIKRGWVPYVAEWCYARNNGSLKDMHFSNQNNYYSAN